MSRPIFLNLFQIRFPVTAIVSILHRITGVLAFLALPFVLWTWQQSLLSQASWNKLAFVLHNNILAKLSASALLIAVIYHVIAGVRHVIMDCHIGDSYCAARCSAWLTLGLTVLLSAWFVGCLWL